MSSRQVTVEYSLAKRQSKNQAYESTGGVNTSNHTSKLTTEIIITKANSKVENVLASALMVFALNMKEHFTIFLSQQHSSQSVLRIKLSHGDPTKEARARGFPRRTCNLARVKSEENESVIMEELYNNLVVEAMSAESIV